MASSHPTLRPQFCFSTSALQDFLRLSRASTDDTITSNLNALLMPSRMPFNPSSTLRRAPALQRDSIPPSSCSSFRNSVLFPSWQARSTVLAYCGSVASSPEDGDISQHATDSNLSGLIDGLDGVEERERRRRAANRADPYSTREVPREGRKDKLADLVRMEVAVENVVRKRTWEVVRRRCGGDQIGSEEWEDALRDWNAGKLGA